MDIMRQAVTGAWGRMANVIRRNIHKIVLGLLMVTLSACSSPDERQTSGFSLEVERSGQGLVTSSRVGLDLPIECGEICQATFEPGASITLTATAPTGSAFVAWGGDCDGQDGTSCTITMTADKSVSALFASTGELTEYRLTVYRDGRGSGVITSNPSGIDCDPQGTDCSETYPEGTPITLTATPSSRSSFGGWRGCANANGNRCTLELTADTIVTSVFTELEYTLDVSTTGNGTVTSTPEGIACGSDCLHAYVVDTNVTLMASVAVDTTVNWQGCDSSSGARCDVSMQSDRHVTAAFSTTGTPIPTRHTLVVNKDGQGTGRISSTPEGIDCGRTCVQEFDAGTRVTLTAEPAPGSLFARWQDCPSAKGDACTLELNEDTTVIAVFSTQGFPLTVKKNGSGTGYVRSAPQGIDCGDTCTYTFSQGTPVTLTATPSSNAIFVGWEGPNCSGTGPCTVEMDQARNVIATFVKLGSLSVTVESPKGHGHVTISPPGASCSDACRYEYPEGTEVLLTAEPKRNSRFRSWSGGCSGSSETCRIILSQDRSVQAKFLPGHGRASDADSSP